ncbi:MAG: penicillin-binding protein activator [Pseudomonadota bacterium]
MPRPMPATQHTKFSLSAALVACLLAALVVGCASPPASSVGPASVDRAALLLRQDNPAAAAQMYEQLAAGNPAPGRNDLALSAARAWLAANRADDAQRVLEAHGTGLTQTQQFERDLLRGEVAVARGQYSPAWQQVSKITEPVKPADASRLFLLQQQVALRAGQPVEAVRAGIERERVAASDAERNRARRDLLNDLRSAIDRGLRVDPAASRDAKVSGWLEIAQIAAAAARNPLAAPAAVDRWRVRFPGHPAASIVASEIIFPGERDSPRTAAVADAAAIGLLLPITGVNAVFAGLVRDGFLAQVSRMPEGSRPVVRVYDTGTMPVGTAIQNARADGARILVGPLTRDEVQEASSQRPTDLPMLLLNNLAGNGFVGSNLYQFALAPEDEARQIARQMVGAGQRNAMVMAPTGSWGSRVATAFAEEFTGAGGQVVAQGSYERSGMDQAARTEAVLGISDSRSRYERIRRVAGDFEFEPRRRPDIDAIFVAGYAPDQGNINPLINMNPTLNRYAAGAPIFMTQDGLDADPQSNRDLAGMYVLDIPWMLETSGPAADLRTATETIWTARGLARSRYFAFGFDAATLALAIRKPSTSWPLNGLTGRLNLNPDGRVERSLQWARVSNAGVAQPADPAAR